MENPPPVPARQPMAPSTATPQSSWPKIMGIIGLIVAILGLLNSLGNIGYLLVMKVIGFERYFEFMTTAMENDPSIPEGDPSLEMFSTMGATMDSMFVPIVVLSLLFLSLMVFMLIASLKLMKRVRKAKPLFIALSYVAIVVSLISAFIGHRINNQMMGEMFAAIDPEMGSMVNSMITIFTIIGVVIAMVVPVFILIWFNRQRIKEEIAGPTWND